MPTHHSVPPAVRIREVGPRDGLQFVKSLVPLSAKVDLINALSRIGFPEIQVTSFVNPRKVPQMADANMVAAQLPDADGVCYSALVLNEIGAERAAAARLKKVEVVVSVSRSHSLANSGEEPDAAMLRAGRIADIARDAGMECSIGFAVALGCPIDGYPSLASVRAMAEQAVTAFGYTDITIADTAGMADPARTERMMSMLIADFPQVAFGLHLHDTRRMGLANVMAGLRCGVRRFDSSIAGLGGCPFIPVASGNVATEDVLNMLDLMGLRTGLDRDALLTTAREAMSAIGEGDSGVSRAGYSVTQT